MPATISITKRFGEYPIAHRQWTHSGHCALLHGHNIVFDITFSCPKRNLDANGFVVDFGEFDGLKAELADQFDHTLLIRQDDPFKARFKKLQDDGLCKLIVVSGGSAKGLAEFVHDIALRWLETSGNIGRQVQVDKVVCWEDSKNSATFDAR